jgi:hypothetical protein
VALGRSGRLQALRQFHLQLSQRKIFIPKAFLILTLTLYAQLGPLFKLLSSLNAYYPDELKFISKIIKL